MSHQYSDQDVHELSKVLGMLNSTTRLLLDLADNESRTDIIRLQMAFYSLRSRNDSKAFSDEDEGKISRVKKLREKIYKRYLEMASNTHFVNLHSHENSNGEVLVHPRHQTGFEQNQPQINLFYGDHLRALQKPSVPISPESSLCEEELPELEVIESTNANALTATSVRVTSATNAVVSTVTAARATSVNTAPHVTYAMPHSVNISMAPGANVQIVSTENGRMLLNRPGANEVKQRPVVDVLQKSKKL